MGLHTGEAVERDDYFGPTVNRTARVMALAHGGQVLLSTNRARRFRATAGSRRNRQPAKLSAWPAA
jgi:class 3 adenylate cyclase